MISWSKNLDKRLVRLIDETEKKIAGIRKRVQDLALVNQSKVLDAFYKHHLSDAHFTNSTGYGYDDSGRDALENIYASTFQTEAALVRPHIISGTHAIATALFWVLRPGDDLLYITGEPYDTLLEVVGVAGNGLGSFKEYNIGYDFVPLNKDNTVDFNAVKEKITEKTKVVAIQRSRGYSSRPSFTVDEIQKMCEFVKAINSEIIIFVDNCYGEFVEEKEPTEVGADLMAGSLIKNPGGGLAKTGGYIVGCKDLVEKCGYRLTIPGVGGEGGAMLGSISDILQGFFLAPHVVSQAVQGAIFTAAILEGCGVSVSPKWNEVRTDLIQIAELKNKKAMVTFCQAIQKFSPIDSFVTALPASMPGYEDEIIMAAGTFVQGATIELSADGPIREPYNLYIQGGLTYEHIKIAIVEAVNDVYFS